MHGPQTEPLLHGVMAEFRTPEELLEAIGAAKAAGFTKLDAYTPYPIEKVLDALDRFHALVVGPGLGRNDETTTQTRLLAVEAPIPTVIDGDGLFAMAWNADGAAALLQRRTAPTVLTPHDGEYALLVGSPPGADRLVAARRLAADTGCVVLLKGAATVVANPDGQVLVVTTGDSRLATAGTGDVLSGIIGALLATGVSAFRAAAAGAWLHGQAAQSAPARGMVASDIAEY